MITFTKKDDNKQFISIAGDENTDTNYLISELKKQLPTLSGLTIITDEAKILIPVEENYNYGFSLNELREAVKPMAKAVISHFSVDVDINSNLIRRLQYAALYFD